MVEVRFTVQVGRDLRRIGDTIAQDNRAAAVAFVEAIRRHCYLLASVPLMGRARPNIGQDIHFRTGATLSSIDFVPRSIEWKS